MTSKAAAFVPSAGACRGAAGLRRRLLAAFVVFVSFCAGTGCAFLQPIERSIVTSRAMRFDDRAADVDLAGEVGSTFGGYVGGGGGCAS